MPVWHAATEALRAEGSLRVIGITQEQHPDRCRLFAQWHEFEWPILWDPLNLTAAQAVPGVFAIDEHGVVVKNRLNPARIDDELIGEFLAGAFDAPGEASPEPVVTRALLESATETPSSACAALLWKGPGAESWRSAPERLAADRSSPTARFRAGVAYRMRYDSEHRRPGDFQAALDLWSEALGMDPNQYIWRRRIQQYGPRLDKPYPFYDWVEQARSEISARGETPVELPVALTGAEIAQPTNVLPAFEEGAEAPDPERKIALDEDGWVAVETAAAMHTASAGARVRQRPSARVHVALHPDKERDVHWTNDAGPTVVWIMVPRGWRVERNLYSLPVPDSDTSSEVRQLDFEATPPEGWRGEAKVRGYALYFACEGVSGECVYRRQDFVVPITSGASQH